MLAFGDTDSEDDIEVGDTSSRTRSSINRHQTTARTRTTTDRIASTDSSSSSSPAGADVVVQAELAPDVDNLIESAIRKQNQNILMADAVATTPEPPGGINAILTKENFTFPPFKSKLDECRYQVEHAILFRGVAPYVSRFLLFTMVISYAWDVIQPDSHSSNEGRNRLLLVYGVIIRIPGMLSLLALWVLAIRPKYRNFFLRYSQWISVVTFGLASLCLKVILYLHDDGYVVANAFIGSCVMTATSLGMLRMKHCLLTCTIAVVASNIAMIIQYYHNYETIAVASSVYGSVDVCLKSYSLAYTLLSTNFFLLLFCQFSLFFSYILELHLRNRYHDTGTIFRWTSTATTTEQQQQQ